jgi:hypothetical protein
LLRTRHEVRLIESAEEGVPLHLLPNGVYGFAYAPGQTDVPLFANRTFQAFEVHKLPDGSEVLVCFVTPQQALDLHAGKTGFELHLYPEPHGDSTQMVSMDMVRIDSSRKGVLRTEGNYLPAVVLE